MIIRKDLKLKAKEHIHGNIWFLLLCAAIVGLLPFVLDFISMLIETPDFSEVIDEILPQVTNMALLSDDYVVTNSGIVIVSAISVLSALASIFISIPLEVGVYNVYMRLYKDKDDKKFSHLFFVFKGENYWRILGLEFLRGIFTFLWSLLFIVPGIIKSISYSQAHYFLLDDPSLKANDAIKKSKEIMKGHKWEYFVLSLSFILWYLLCVVTFGIASIYVNPYVEMTFTCYHYKLVNECETQTE